MSKRIIEFLRRNMLVILFSLLIIGQVLTWRAIIDLGTYLPRNPPNCIVHDPCMVQLDEYTLRRLEKR